MARLTPEQEAAYALDYGVSRADLEPPVQAEYDRLLAGRRAARAAGKVPEPRPLRQLPVSYPRSPDRLLLLFLLPVSGFLFPVAIAADLGDPLPGVIAGTVLLLALGYGISWLSRQVMLRADLIRFWQGWIRFTNIGINEIAGVGMLYNHVVGYRGSWRLYIWRDFGPAEPAGFSFQRLRGSWNDGPLADSELRALAASRAGIVCRDIYRQVLAAQGSEGQLATRQLQKHYETVGRSRYSQVTAYWSPDGEAGRCHRQQGTGEVDLIGYPLEEQAPRGRVQPAAPRPHEPYWRRWLVEDDAGPRNGNREPGPAGAPARREAPRTSDAAHRGGDPRSPQGDRRRTEAPD